MLPYVELGLRWPISKAGLHGRVQGPVVHKDQWFTRTEGLEGPVVYKDQWFRGTSGLEGPVVQCLGSVRGVEWAGVLYLCLFSLRTFEVRWLFRPGLMPERSLYRRRCPEVIRVCGAQSDPRMATAV